MKRTKTVMFLGLVGLAVTATQVSAGSGDLIVNGNLGIGPSNPNAKVEIQTTPTANAVVTGLRVTNFGGGAQSGAAILAGFNNSDDQAGFKGYYNGSSITLGFVTGSSEKMTIRNNGTVGIGTTWPLYTLDVYGQIAISDQPIITSDLKFKKNVVDIDSPLQRVLSLKGHKYEMRTDEFQERKFTVGQQYGVIAQEVESILPEIVKTDEKGNKSVAYGAIIPVLIEAIKEQQAMIVQQQARIDKLEKHLPGNQ